MKIIKPKLSYRDESILSTFTEEELIFHLLFKINNKEKNLKTYLDGAQEYIKEANSSHEKELIKELKDDSSSTYHGYLNSIPKTKKKLNLLNKLKTDLNKVKINIDEFYKL